MTCPSCSRSTRDFTNSSGLVTRCDDAWHARALAGALAHGDPSPPSPATPEDFVRRGPAQLAGPTITCACGVKKTSYGPDGKTTLNACPFCGRPDPRTLPRTASWPFDPNPRPLEPAQNGFRWCHDCESVQPAAGHECAPDETPSAMNNPDHPAGVRPAVPAKESRAPDIDRWREFARACWECGAVRIDETSGDEWFCANCREVYP